MCARNYSGTRFTAIIWGLIRVPIPVLVPAGYWIEELCGSFRSTTSIPQFRFVRWLIHIYMKGVTQVFSPWVDSDPWVKLALPLWACHPLRGKIEKKFLFLLKVLTVFIFIFILPLIKELFHWFLPVGVCVRVSKSDVNYGVSMDLTESPEEDVTSGLQFEPPPDVPPPLISFVPGG